MLSQIKSPDEINAMRQAGKILAGGLEYMRSKAKPGVSTEHLADLALEYIASKPKAKPAFLNHPGSGGAPPFPAAACISLNDAVVHGVPSAKTILKAGDVLSLDLGVSIDGMIVDGAITMIVGESDESRRKLVEITRKSLYAGLKQIKHGCRTGDIGAAIADVLSAAGYGIVRDLVGHGVGYSIHEDPNIPNFGKRGHGDILQSGMTVAIEPMATLGDYGVYIDSDGWTVRTRDGSVAAHFEHTVLVTEHGHEILTSA